MAEYRLVAPLSDMPVTTVQRTSDGAFIPFDEANKDYQEYLTWIEAGGVPDPANSDYQEYLEWRARGNEPDPAPEGTV